MRSLSTTGDWAETSAAPPVTWSQLFDLETMRKFIPVIEWHEFRATVAVASQQPPQREHVIDATGTVRMQPPAPPQLKRLEVEIDWVLYIKQKPWVDNRPETYPIDVEPCDNEFFRSQYPYHTTSMTLPVPSGSAQRAETVSVYTSSISAYRGSFTRTLHCVSVFSPYSGFIPLLQHAVTRWSLKQQQLVLDSQFHVDLDKYDANAVLKGKQRKADRLRPIQRVHTSPKPAADSAASAEVVADITKGSPSYFSVLIDRAETLFWDGAYGTAMWWGARKHQAFSTSLQEIARAFR